MRKKSYLLTLILCFIFCMLSGTVFADANTKVEVTILSPDQVKDYPGKEAEITTRITNLSNMPIEDIMVYITMADLNKHWTVNLEDYSADKPVVLSALQPGETKEVKLPIRFVYTSKYHLYVTAASTKERWITSSSAIPIEIMGNTKIDPTIVQVVSYSMPVILFAGWVVALLRRRKQMNLT
jgi:hypothetical protein